MPLIAHRIREDYSSRTDDQQLEATRPSWHTLMVNTGKGYAGGQLGNADTNILVQYKHPNPILVND